MPNRRALDRYLADALPRSVADDQVLAVAMIDLDDFKIINDTHGHVGGDRLLKGVAQRIQPLLTKHDFFARLGGDEFVVVFHERSQRRAEKHLRKRFDAIGRRFRAPLDVGLDRPIHVGLSMGIALSPQHASEGGMLLRLADEALFKVKRNKLERANWWSIHGEVDEEELAVSIAPYGDSAAETLDVARPHLADALSDIVDEFYALVHTAPHASRLLNGLAPKEIEHLKQRQILHVQLLTSGSTTRKSLIEASRRAGRIHALIGIDSVLLMRWMAIYHESLVRQCNMLPISKRSRYHLAQLLDHRLQDDLQAQLEAQTFVQDRYAAIIDQFMPDRGSSWNDAISLEMRLLARLPGMACVMVLRQSGPETYNIESSAGTAAHAVAGALRAEYGVRHSANLAPPDDSLLSKSWHTAEIHTCPHLAEVPDNTPALPRALMQDEIRAAACIPVIDEQRLPVALLLLLGHYPNQFESKYMQHFMRNLQLRGNEIWQRSMRPPPPVPYEQAVAFRRRLFKDGLRMLLQPVIDFRSGRVTKVEALARLTLESGEQLGPDVFLPLLRNTELDTLFQRGLDMALSDLVELERQGLRIDLALNISPHTLAEPDCPEWVAEALERHGLAPQRLILEILENQRVDRAARDAGVQRLVTLGVRFAIDDLGSGYSSLRRLASLPFDAVKIDQDLLARLHVDPVQSITLISAVVQIGRDFGCKVIAEGLEDPGMIEVARLLGASMGQGYAIARPMPAADLPAWSRQFVLDTGDDGPKTPLGGLAFQWISVRHGSLHTKTLEDCPLTRLMQCHNQHAGDAKALHAAVHADPQDARAAHRLLEWMQACILGPDAALRCERQEKGRPD
ncbi:EAL domain-containing protein [Oleiagrimonas sp. MCCC 1A03011]|uniref:EAL domain-containing protein n=1 Tax=Oleiagrimonas sp. MCCC 1A03011 TaxID=1926883 RepID=UPI00210588F5|nr:EAL domain-containing protein [Oleiagrimonas sp. MCCC 1A03011]